MLVVTVTCAPSTPGLLGSSPIRFMVTDGGTLPTAGVQENEQDVIPISLLVSLAEPLAT
jgi:hypothetical protein